LSLGDFAFESCFTLLLYTGNYVTYFGGVIFVFFTFRQLYWRLKVVFGRGDLEAFRRVKGFWSFNFTSEFDNMSVDHIEAFLDEVGVEVLQLTRSRTREIKTSKLKILDSLRERKDLVLNCLVCLGQASYLRVKWLQDDILKHLEYGLNRVLMCLLFALVIVGLLQTVELFFVHI